MTATFVPHIRLTMSGTLPSDADEFSMNLSLRREGHGLLQYLLGDFPPNPITENWRDACVDWFGRATTHISAYATLKSVKVAAIAADGSYGGVNPREYGVNQPGGGDTTPVYPVQDSLAVTLETDADLGRVKGRIYLPMPSVPIDVGSQRISAGLAEEIRDSTVQLVNDLANGPGLDATQDWRVVVASQGRHNPDGTIRLAAGNHDIQRVSVGRRLDIQRRRASKYAELRTAAADVNQV